jgi:hypothetical protein
MENAANKIQRPSSITLISVFIIYSGLLGFYFIIRNGIQGLGLGTTLFFAIVSLVFLICGVGFWLMKKWAFYVYTVFAIIDQIVLLVMGRWTIMALLIPAIVIYAGYKQLSKMS